jgi:hypothetical protein
LNLNNNNNNNNNNKRERLRSVKATSVFWWFDRDLWRHAINKKAWFDHFPCNAQRTVVDDCLCLSFSFDKVVSLSYQS